MSIAIELQKFSDKAMATHRQVFVVASNEAHRSVTKGSEITSAPGQPVQSGDLLNSYTEVDGEAGFQMDPDAGVASIMTNKVYARSIEDQTAHWSHSVKPLVLRSTVGGFHSLKLTVAGWKRIVAYAVQHVTGNG